ncbi:PQQ-dependent dehydrogenase, methanol/ethanol family [Acidobacteria bacterium AH-259-A15]|nr:PQQ-dependent dehydrogenase, methanol/ethanol family [Acidobacteria bacterium AH-259-A15]
MKRFSLLILLFSFSLSVQAQVTYERLLRPDQEPENWLTYSGMYESHRHSRLDQINRENIHKLGLKWVFQMRTLQKVETTPLVMDGIMYLTKPPNDAFALDTRTGRPFWSYKRQLPEQLNVCCGQVNRGFAIQGDRLYMGTVDAHLVALDAKTGSLIWDVEVADYKTGYSVTVAPLVVKDKIIVGIAGGEYGIRGFVDAYDAKTGERVWRFYTIPGPGEPGNKTWEGDSWKTGGAGTWVTGSFDPELNLIYWGTGNPGPDWNGEVRKGDNLYSDSVVALDADTGKLKWYFQFTPHDVWDWDAVQIPVLVDMEFQGRPRKLMLWANRNAFYYVLDRETGEFLLARPFAKQTWAEGIDAKGRPIVKPNTAPSKEGTLIYPGVGGGTNWYSPSYSPLTGLLYVSARDYANIFFTSEATYIPGNEFLGSFGQGDPDDPGHGAVRALIPVTGELKWEYKLHTKPVAGILTTAGNVLFSGTAEGQFFALDASSGRELWRANTGGTIVAGPITYLSEGEQLVSIAAGSAIFTFGIKD